MQNPKKTIPQVMKTQKIYRMPSNERRTPLFRDQSLWLAALTLLVMVYIVFYFIYPMFSKGLLF